MARNFADSAADAFDGLKSRLGFGRKDDEFYDDGYDNYDDEYNGSYDDGYDDYASERDGDSAVGGFRPATTRTSYSARSTSSRFGHGESAAGNLVSIGDVKARTQVPERLQRDPLAPSADRGTSNRGTSLRSSANAGASASGAGAYRADSATSRASRSEGYDSLFEPAASPTFTPYDPYEAYSTSNPASYSSARSLTVIKPVVYGDVERVARAVKSGDVVVLVMRNTPDDLSKRILDFSFGVASALDANVECPGDKVFAIARGEGISEDEKARLRNQGAL